jgi:hypothetical protein
MKKTPERSHHSSSHVSKSHREPEKSHHYHREKDIKEHHREYRDEKTKSISHEKHDEKPKSISHDKHDYRDSKNSNHEKLSSDKRVKDDVSDKKMRSHSIDKHSRKESHEPQRASKHKIRDPSPVHQHSSKSSKKIDDEDKNYYGPAMPPSVAPTSHKVEEKRYIGPAMPPTKMPDHQAMDDLSDVIISDEEDDLMIGPIPFKDGAHMSERDLELEKRKIQLKLRELDKRTEELEGNHKNKTRELWMMELPDLPKAADLGVGPRQFRRNDRPDFSDRGSWTKAPNDKNYERDDAEEKHKKSEDKRRRDEMIAKRDAEQEEQARKHKKLHKRDKSLLELHEKKMKKEKVCTSEVKKLRYHVRD